MIVSSEARPGHAQRDGRRYVIETHQHEDRSIEVLEYGPISTDKVDLNAIAVDRAQRLNDEREEQSQLRVERKAAEDKAVAVLEAALVKGEVTEDELRKAGVLVPRERVAVVAEVTIRG